MDSLDILIFDIKGKFAHFRKFYTNSSALTYSIPPRTAIEGIIAAVLGYERDSYYEKFSKSNFNAAVKKMTSTRKIMQSLNYVKATSVNSLYTLNQGHTQIPLELVTSNQNICYRMYISYKDKDVMDELEYRIKNKKYNYSPYLGAAPFNCSLEYIDRINAEKFMKNALVKISTPINEKYINSFKINFDNESLFLTKEKMPCEFLKDRNIKEVNSYIYDENGAGLNVSLNCECYNLKYDNINENIIFM